MFLRKERHREIADVLQAHSRRREATVLGSKGVERGCRWRRESVFAGNNVKPLAE
jgi:hypothetical protein